MSLFCHWSFCSSQYLSKIILYRDDLMRNFEAFDFSDFSFESETFSEDSTQIEDDPPYFMNILFINQLLYQERVKVNQKKQNKIGIFVFISQSYIKFSSIIKQVIMKKYNQDPSKDSNYDHQSKEQDHPNSNGHSEANTDGFFRYMFQNYFNPPNHLSSPKMPLNNHNDGQSLRCSNGMIGSLLHIVQSQTQSLDSLNHRVQEIVGRNKELLIKIRQLERENELLKSGEKKRDQQQKGWKEPINEIKIEGESVNKQTLLQILFGKQKYQYELRLVQPIDRPLYRERNFNIIMELLDKDGNQVSNSNKIPMSLALYTCQNPPKFIEKNTSGQKMLKGYVDQALISGVCHFEKVQIRQVTSHYRNGCIFFVAIPCMTPLGANKTQNFVDFTKIKPLVIDQVIVKAKKPKKKDQKKEQSED